MKKKESCTGRSKEFLEKQGYITGNTEKDVRIPSKTRPGQWETFKRDLFNFTDLVAIKADVPGTLYVQTTTRAHQADRIQKILSIPEHKIILAAGNRIHVHGWAKVGPRGQRKLWQVTVTDIQDVIDNKTQPQEVVSVGGGAGLFDDEDEDW